MIKLPATLLTESLLQTQHHNFGCLRMHITNSVPPVVLFRVHQRHVAPLHLTPRNHRKRRRFHAPATASSSMTTPRSLIVTLWKVTGTAIAAVHVSVSKCNNTIITTHVSAPRNNNAIAHAAHVWLPQGGNIITVITIIINIVISNILKVMSLTKMQAREVRVPVHVRPFSGGVVVWVELGVGCSHEE